MRMGRFVLTGTLALLLLAPALVLFTRDAGAVDDAPDYGKGALTFLGLVRDGNVDEAHAYFNDEVGKMIKPSQLKEIWQQLADRAGGFEKFGTPIVTKVDQYHAADVPVIFKNAEVTLRVAWDNDGAIAGFRVVGGKERTESPASSAASSSPAPSSAAPTPSQAPTTAPSAVPVSPSEASSGFEGHWEGGVEVMGQKLPLRLDFARADTTWSGTIDSPQQGANGLKMSDIKMAGDQVEFGCKEIPGNALFRCKLVDGKLTGTLTQMGMEMQAAFSREKAPPPNRPQEPKPPFPYREETVGYMNGDVKLEGTLTIPEGKGPFPTVLLISGSGAQNRDEEIFGHKPFLVIADYLSRAGIAVLRVDDRGIGGSTGRGTHPTSADFAEDAQKGIEFLRARPECDKKKIGLIGHSEGGFIAPMLASRPKNVAFIVLLAGTGVPGDEVIRRQTELIYKNGGMGGEALAKILSDQRAMHEMIKAEADSVSLRDAAWKAAAADVPGSNGGMDLTPEQKQQVDLTADRQAAVLSSPWFRYFIKTDPRPFLRKVTVPVLALNGEFDLQVEPKQNLPEIEKALKEGGNKDVTTKLLPKLNHLFQTSTSGAPTEYGTIEETFSPTALEIIRNWILERFGKR
jgi:uncharacterized protein